MTRLGILSTRRGRSLAVMLGLSIGLLSCASSTASNAPAWRLGAVLLPTDLAPGGSGQLQLQIMNIGDAPSDGSPVTLVDHLPKGVIATEAGALVHGEAEIEAPGQWGECAITEAGRTVSCTVKGLHHEEEGGVINPVSYFNPGYFIRSAGQAPAVGIKLSVEHSAPEERLSDTATLSGGGAAIAATATTPMVISSAPAPFGIASIAQSSTNVDGSPDTQAGSHPYANTTSFFLNSKDEKGSLSGEMKDFHLDLPAGFIGNPSAVPKCSREAFDNRLLQQQVSPDCPSDTQVGVALVDLSNGFLVEIAVYNLVPPAGVAAQFGFAFEEKLGFIDASVRTGGSYNASVDVHNIIQQGILGASVTLWGNPSDPSHDEARYEPGGSGAVGGKICNEENQAIVRCHIPFGEQPRPFLALSTSCGEQALSVSLDSWETASEPAASVPPTAFTSTDAQGNPVPIEGCERLDFNPSISVQPETGSAESPTGLAVDLKVPQSENPAGLAEAHLKEALVSLPVGMAVSPSAANGLGACTLEEIGLASAKQPSCPDSSKIGSVQAQSPLVDHPLTGSVYLAQQGNAGPAQGANPFGSLIALYMVVNDPQTGVLVKLAGEGSLDPVTGQMSARFGEDPIRTAATGQPQFLPQLPISDVKMSFFGGPRAPLITPSGCGTYATSSQLTPWSGTPAAESSSFFTIGAGCSGGFKPSLTAGTFSNQAAAFSPFSATLSRQDGEQRLAGVQVTTPAGLLGVLKSVTRCPEPQASQGTCGPESEIGETTATAGPGPDPVVVKGGRVYLTGPYKGAPFGLSIVVPAVAGPFNLGNVIVRAAITVDPSTAQITVSSDPLPTILQGVPLDVRTVNVTVNRPGFIFNPTNCSPLSVTGKIASTSGTGADVSSPFQAANCATLPFAPKLAASAAGHASKTNGTSFTVKVNSAGLGKEADIAKVELQLPKALPSRLTTIQKACPVAVFQANPATCPEGSNIGHATIQTPLLQSPVSGPAYLVSHAAAAFPDVEFVLQGEGITLVLDGKTDIKKGITYSRFDTAPDAPFTTFETVLPAGPHSALTSNVPEKAKFSLCGTSLAMPTEIVGQNGAVIHQSTKIAVTGCAKAKTAKKKAKKARRARRAAHRARSGGRR